jgi:hypothetical protein
MLPVEVDSVRRSYTIDSMRRSGTNHIRAITTYSVMATHGRANANDIAST